MEQKKLLDIKPYLNTFEVFKKLKNAALFKKVKADTGGFGIVWNSKIDLDVCDAWEFGKAI